MLAVNFTNATDEDFTDKWDGVSYTVKKGQVVLLQDYIAIHLAKGLAVREMNKSGVPANSARDERGNFTNAEFNKEVAKYISQDQEDQVKEDTQEKLDIAMIQKKKIGRPKKIEVKEQEFPDLNKE